ncbi:glucanosyltransferase [Flavobacterium sp. 1]|uniref:hypothetical protein n=1 Tax=Flavobacterium sp. 1 TaxID=2035200 RepID=UPI000C248B9E|nr:hypothetical protein [Flavobacterium sp. 1]PJJ07661.1 glucanosyltransferase [Flavobacterium sp. 1]
MTNLLSTISISGKAFVYGTENTRFMVRGIALSATSTLNNNLNIKDILANDHNNLMVNTIIPQLQLLNANCIRVYQVDPNNQHNLSMASLASAGIYVMVGLATSENSIKQMTGEYSQETFNHAARVVDEFQAYDNTFCFSVGNEVEFPGQQASNLNTANPNTLPSQIVLDTVNLELTVAQAMKSFARDIKFHIAANNYRIIPVGAAMQDGPQSSWGSSNPILYQRGLIGTDIIAQYYTAGGETDRMDYIGINSYRYVTGSTPPDSAYLGLGTEVQPLAVPVFLTETGGLGSVARDWKDVNSMYTVSSLYQQLSGQVAFQMLEEGAGYGLYTVGDNNALTTTELGGAADLLQAFSTVSTEPLNPVNSMPVAPTTAPASAGSPPFTITWPTDLLPLKIYSAPNAAITVNNYATCNIQIVQQGVVMGTVSAATDGDNPVSASIQVNSGVAISIQGYVNSNWDAVCGVPASNVVDGITVSNDVDWGTNVQCNLMMTPVASFIQA